MISSSIDDTACTSCVNLTGDGFPICTQDLTTHGPINRLDGTPC